MRKSFFLVIAVILSGLIAPGASASSSAEESARQTLRITKYAPNVNQACPKGSDKLFIVKVFVRKRSLGNFVDGNRGVGEIVLTNDRQLNADDYVVSPLYTENDFFFFAPNRAAKVKMDPLENSVTVELIGPNMELRLGALKSDCTERYGLKVK